MILNRFPDEKRFGQLAEKCNVIPVGVEILADTETPVTLLQKFYGKTKPVFLLESVEGGEKWGRYSFLGLSARTRFRVFKQRVEIENHKKPLQVIEHQGDPIQIFKDYMGAYVPAQVPELPRFWGGLVGYLAYEMVAFFEKIPNRLGDDTVLAHFILPDELIIFDNVHHTMAVVVIAFTEDHAETAGCFKSTQQRLQALVAQAQQMPAPVHLAKHNGQFELQTTIADEDFRSMVRRVKEHILAGDVIQTVISQPFVCETLPDLWTLYRAQRYVNPSPYLFYMDLDDTVLIGSSPETMVRLENGVATLRPIAGTRPRGAGEQADRALADELLKDEKEKAEHLMLVDLGRNDLGRVAETGSVQVTDLMFVERYSHVMHLVSNICCDLKPRTDAWDLLRATFPAGTLTGAPKVRAMEIIADLEQTPRGAYGGAVGYISFTGNMDLAITIRTAQIENNRLIVRAGAGIVADSDPEKERQECINKARAMQKALEMIHQS